MINCLIGLISCEVNRQKTTKFGKFVHVECRLERSHFRLELGSCQAYIMYFKILEEKSRKFGGLVTGS